MDKSTTKGQILEASLELFSRMGFEATSISMIADAVGIRKASLYSHYQNKQDILDTLVKIILEQYDQHSIFSKADWDDHEFTKDKHGMNAEIVTQMIIGQLRYILHDPDLSRARKMMIIEQFQNKELADICTRQNYTDVLKFNTGMIRFLIREGKLRNENPDIMGAQFCGPISVWLGLCDREPEREPEIMELVGKHIRQFFKIYAK